MTPFIVPTQKKPIRLDLFLIEKFGQSRAFWKKELSRRVKVNQKPAQKGMMLQGGEELQVEGLENSHQSSYIPDPQVAFKVCYEDEAVLVVEKTPGISVHPLKTSEKGTLFQGVLAQYPEIGNIGTSPREGGLLHRLDLETSGLVLFARTQKAYNFLKEELKKRRIEKEYIALVEGRVEKANAKIEIPIAHHPKNKKKMIAVFSEKMEKKLKSRPAVTLYQVLKKYENFTLLQIQLLTGLRHQIRIHLESLGHPILGDAIYGPPENHLHEIPRLFLHASRLTFRHPQSLQKIEVRCPLPEDLSKFLQTLSATKSDLLR